MTLHVIHFSGGINATASMNIQSCCLQAMQQGATKIRLNIASEGGSTIYGFAIYSFLKSLPVPVDTHNLGSVMSMANIVFLAGENRTATPDSRFVLHPLHWFFNNGPVDNCRLNEYSDTLNDDQERYASIFESRTSRADDRLDVRAALKGQHEILAPERALSAGIIHGIYDLPLEQGSGFWWASA